MFPIFSFIKWSLDAMAKGFYPSARHDLASFSDDNDTFRVELAGAPMCMPSALIYIKADWAELVTSFGLPAWNDGLRPCLYCNCSTANMYDFCSATEMDELQWRPNEVDDYDAACARCEIHVVVSRDSHAKVVSCLALVPLKGYMLVRDVPELLLLKQDRLEPSVAVPDVMEFDAITTFPHPCVFWRPSQETNSRHRNPFVR